MIQPHVEARFGEITRLFNLWFATISLAIGRLYGAKVADTDT